jgi:hypothetical protein
VQAKRGQFGGTVTRGTITACRDRPGTYLTIVEAKSAESALANCLHPEAGDLVAE